MKFTKRIAPMVAALVLTAGLTGFTATPDTAPEAREPAGKYFTTCVGPTGQSFD